MGAFEAKDLIPAGAITMIAAGLLLHYRKKKANLSHNRMTPHEELERNRRMRGVRGDLEDLMVEIEQLAKRFGNQLDAKTIELEDLLRKADQRLAQLERMLEQAEEGANANLSNSPNTSPVALTDTVSEPEPELPDDPLARSVYKLADDGIEPPDIAQQLGEHIGKVELILALRRTG